MCSPHMTDHGRTEPRPAHDTNARTPSHAERCRTIVSSARSATLSTMFDEVGGATPDKQRRWVVLVDGEPRQLRAVKAEARRDVGSSSRTDVTAIDSPSKLFLMSTGATET
jgi:hypothetical protein